MVELVVTFTDNLLVNGSILGDVYVAYVECTMIQ